MTARFRLAGLLLLAGTTLGCATEDKEPPQPDVPVDLGTELGAYAGVLPCGYCGGIRTELHLYTEPGSGRPRLYTLKQTYLATRDGDRTVERTGRWTILRGSAQDADATVFQIAYNDPQLQQSFLKVSEDELRLLDRMQGEIPSEAPLSLHRIAGKTAGI